MTGTGPLVAFETFRLVGIPSIWREIRVSPFGFLVPSFSLQLYVGSSSVSPSPLVHDFPCPSDATGTPRSLLLVVRVLPSTPLPGFTGPESSVLLVNLPPSAPARFGFSLSGPVF